MITYAQGNLLESSAEALVNTVNCVGFMGKGIALQFKQAFPENYHAYQKACRNGEVIPGRMFIQETRLLSGPQYIINFPTKRHWRGKSQVQDIESGLQALVEDVGRLGIHSIAVPPLGCGNGGLDWNIVNPMIVSAFDGLSDVEVFLYPPQGAPEPTTMPIRTTKPELTTARAFLIVLMARYLTSTYRLTLLEIQKLAYFLQEAGEPLRLNYEAGIYGPYAMNLNKVLERLEGHFTRGYGDTQRPDVEIELLPGAAMAAESFLEGYPESQKRTQYVGDLIDGFETPYGMELLATVHWVANYAKPAAENLDSAVCLVHSWNVRKRAMFKPEHIRVAWDRLYEQGWLHGADSH